MFLQLFESFPAPSPTVKGCFHRLDGKGWWPPDLRKHMGAALPYAWNGLGHFLFGLPRIMPSHP